MDKDGWYKVINMFTKKAGASADNIQILYYDGHDSHWDSDALDLMCERFIQPFVLKAGDSENDQPQDNGSNAKLKSCYNNRKSEWSRKFLSTAYSPAHMNTVLVLAWQDFVTEAAGIIKRSFDKTKLCPVQPPSADTKFLGNACLSSMQCGTGKKSKELEIMLNHTYKIAKFTTKRTRDEYVVINTQRNYSRNVMIRSVAYDALYDTVVVPAQKLKDIQQEIDALKKVKVTKHMNPRDTRMNPDSTSGIYVAGEARAHARLVEENKRKHAQEEAAKKIRAAARNTALRNNRTAAFLRVHQTVKDNSGSLGLSDALTKHKPASDFALALQHLGTKPSSLPDGKKATVIDALVRLHCSAFDADSDPTSLGSMLSYGEEEEVDVSNVPLAEV